MPAAGRRSSVGCSAANLGQVEVWCSSPCWEATVDLGGRWYIIGVLDAREVREGHGAGEEGSQVAASGGLGADPPSVLQLRVRVLEMSSVFAELPDGALRSLAEPMQAVALGPGDTPPLGGRGRRVGEVPAMGVGDESVN